MPLRSEIKLFHQNSLLSLMSLVLPFFAVCSFERFCDPLILICLNRCPIPFISTFFLSLYHAICRSCSYWSDKGPFITDAFTNMGAKCDAPNGVSFSLHRMNILGKRGESQGDWRCASCWYICTKDIER